MKAWLVNRSALIAVLICRVAYRRPAIAEPSSLGVARSVLVIKLDAMGDFVLATPFLRELRRAAPQARITLVTGPAASSLAAVCPYVDEVLTLCPDNQPRRFGALWRVLRLAQFLARQVPGLSFDLALLPRSGADLNHGRLLAYLSGAPKRVGFAQNHDPCPPGAALTLALPYPASPVHEVEANLALLRALGATPKSAELELHCSPAEEGQLAVKMERAGLHRGEPLVVLGVGASLPHKLWPAENFLRLARHISDTRMWPVILVGDAGDRSRFPPSSGRVYNWAGELTPAQTWALLRSANLFVGNDSGPLHLAAAAGSPCLVVTWDRADADVRDVNSFHRFHPYGVPYRMLHPASAEGRREAAQVSFDRVAQAALEFTGQRSAPNPVVPVLTPALPTHGTLILFSNTVPMEANGSFIILRRHLLPLVQEGWTLKVVSYFPPPSGVVLFWEHIQLPLRERFWPPANPRWLPLMCLRRWLLHRSLLKRGILQGATPRILLTNLWDPQASLAAVFARSGAGPLGIFFHDDEIQWNEGSLPRHYLAWNRAVATSAADKIWVVSDRLAAQLNPAVRHRCRVLRPIPGMLQAPPSWHPSFEAGVHVGYAGKIYPGLWPLLAQLGEELAARGGRLTIITDPETVARLPSPAAANLQLKSYFPQPEDSVQWLQAHCSAVLVAHPLPGSLPPGKWQMLRSSFPSKLAEYAQFGLPLLLIGDNDSEFATWVKQHSLIPFFTDPGSTECLAYLTALRSPEPWAIASRRTQLLARSYFDPKRLQAEFVADLAAMALHSPAHS